MKMGLIVYQNEDIEKVKREFEILKNKAIENFKSNEILESRDSFVIVKSDIKISFQVSKLNSREYAIFQMLK